MRYKCWQYRVYSWNLSSIKYKISTIFVSSIKYKISMIFVIYQKIMSWLYGGTVIFLSRDLFDKTIKAEIITFYARKQSELSHFMFWDPNRLKVKHFGWISEYLKKSCARSSLYKFYKRYPVIENWVLFLTIFIVLNWKKTWNNKISFAVLPEHSV